MVITSIRTADISTTRSTIKFRFEQADPIFPEGHDKPMDVLISATSLSAESLGLGAQIGTVAAGFEADLVATDGNPLDDITAVRRVVFVIKGGKVYRNAK